MDGDGEALVLARGETTVEGVLQRRLRRDRTMFAWMREGEKILQKPPVDAPRFLQLQDENIPKLSTYCSANGLESSYFCVDSCTSVLLHFRASS